MDIDGFRSFKDSDRFPEGRLHDHLMEMERQGWRLITARLFGDWYDAENDVARWEKVEIRDWRSGDILGIYTPESYWELDYGHERWYDAEHYYE